MLFSVDFRGLLNNNCLKINDLRVESFQFQTKSATKLNKKFYFKILCVFFLKIFFSPFLNSQPSRYFTSSFTAGYLLKVEFRWQRYAQKI